MSIESMKTLKKAAYFPFGLGRRMCPGRGLGEIVSRMLIVKILTKYNVIKCPSSNNTKIFGGVYGYLNPKVTLEKRTLAA